MEEALPAEKGMLESMSGMISEFRTSRGVTGNGHSEFGARGRVLRDPPATFAGLVGAPARDHARWRARLSATPGDDRTEIVDALAVTLLTITCQLVEEFRTPDLGNKPDAVDELVYIILSRRTREGAYQAAFDALKGHYETWEEVATADADELEACIAFSGLGRRKAVSLKSALGGLITRFGRCTLEPTEGWTDREVLDFLCGLPEIGPKSAACVMVCSLDRPAFPVDAHVGRVLERLAALDVLGIDLTGRDHKFKQSATWDAIPPSLRYLLHVNMLVLGRQFCLPSRPRCGSCPISSHCRFHGSGRVVPAVAASRRQN
jgi:endonuclease III